jgi:formamidopyrimidine-DNA glycosylase
MPELPEVETVRRTLAPAIGHIVEAVWSGRSLLRGARIPGAALRRAAVGAAIEPIRRWGKYLLLDFAGRDRVLVAHLGMTGRFRLHRRGEPRVAHTHLVVSLSGDLELRYSDPRRFGHLSLAPRGRESEHPPLAVLGIDALDPGLDGAVLYRATCGRGRQIKALLLDQSVVAGVGNIYASEALWWARIKPTLRAGALSCARADLLAEAIGAVLRLALERGGTSLRDFVAADGAQGDNSAYLQVYDRAGEPCLRRGCGGLIRRRVLHGRSTFHCPRCQSR